MDRDVPVHPSGFVAALSLDKVSEGLRAVAPANLCDVRLLLCEAVSASVAASDIAVKAYREIAQNDLASATA